MDKEQLWKVLREPAIKTCSNCRHYHVLTDKIDESLKCVVCRTNDILADRENYWEYDGKSK